MTKYDALEKFMKARPRTSTEEEDFLAGWAAAVEEAADLVEDFREENTYYRAGVVIRGKML